MAIPRRGSRKITFFMDTDAREVLVAGDFTGWLDKPIKLKKSKNGGWKIDISLPPGRYEYRFLVDGTWADDPNCPAKVVNPFGTDNCVRLVDCD